MYYGNKAELSQTHAVITTGTVIFRSCLVGSRESKAEDYYDMLLVNSHWSIYLVTHTVNLTSNVAATQLWHPPKSLHPPNGDSSNKQFDGMVQPEAEW